MTEARSRRAEQIEAPVKRKAAERWRPGGSDREARRSVLRGARQRSMQALDATLSRLVNAASPLLDRKGYKVVLVREPLVPRLAQKLRHLTMLLGRFRHGPIVSSVDPPGRRPNPGGSFPDRQWGVEGRAPIRKFYSEVGG